MKKITERKLKLAEVVLDFNIHPRQAINDVTTNKYQKAYQMGADFPPIRVDLKSMRVVDGFHRTTALVKNKAGEVNAEIFEFEDDKDLVYWAMAWNSRHGQNLTEIDYARCYIIGTKTGMTKESIAEALKITLQKIENAKPSAATGAKMEKALKGGAGIFDKLDGHVSQPTIISNEDLKKHHNIFQSPGAVKDDIFVTIDWHDRYEKEHRARIDLEKQNKALKEQIKRLISTVLSLKQQINPDETEEIIEAEEEGKIAN